MGDFDNLDSYGGGGEFDALDSYAHAPAPGATDVGPEARKAMGGGSPSGPREVPREELEALPDTRSNLDQFTRHYHRPDESRIEAGFNEMLYGGGPPSGPLKSVTQAYPQEMSDPVVRAMTAGSMAAVTGQPLRAIPAVGAIAGPAVEGGVASKASGGDFKTGALIGGGLAAMRPTIGALAGGENRAISDIAAGRIRPAQALREELGRGNLAAGEPKLADVLAETPEARKAIMTQARTNPGGAAKTVGKVIDNAVEENDAVYAQIQRQHGGVPLVSVTDRVARLRDKLNAQGNGIAADAAERFRVDLLKRYATSGKVTADLAVSPQLKLGAQQIRTIRNNAADTAFGGGFKDISANSRQAAIGKIHGEINAAIEEVAANTSKVDLAALKLRNRQISTLAPVRDALQDRADLAIDAERSLLQRARGLPRAAVRRGARELDYRLSDFTAPPPATTVPLLQQTQQKASDVRALGGSPAFAGQIEPGNVDLTNRPRVRNADGSISTVRSMSFGENGQEILVPTVSEDGRIMSDEEAIAQYHKTGRHLGKFRTIKAADAAAEAIHKEQEAMGDAWGKPLAVAP